MNFIEAVVSGFRKYATCKGRASRSEYWYWTLFCATAASIIGFLDATTFHAAYDNPHFFSRPLSAIFTLVTIVPSLALGIRRLHDVDRKSTWAFLIFTVVGIVLLIFWACKRGTNGANRFGSDPSDSSNVSLGNSPKKKLQDRVSFVVLIMAVGGLILASVAEVNAPHTGDVAKLERLAVQGDAEAQVKLAKFYHYGRGVEQDRSKSAELFRQAAERGNVDAQFMLGGLLHQGEGVQKNDLESYEWLLLAHNNGHSVPDFMFDVSAKHLSSADLSTAEAWVDVWKPYDGSDIGMIGQKLQSQFDKCWKIPAGLSTTQLQPVEVRIHVNLDHTLHDIQVVNQSRMNTDNNFKVMAESVQEAFGDATCKHLDLPSQQYNAWKTLDITFDPRKFTNNVN